jgi:hypothetical protein
VNAGVDQLGCDLFPLRAHRVEWLSPAASPALQAIKGIQTVKRSDGTLLADHFSCQGALREKQNEQLVESARELVSALCSGSDKSKTIAT